MRLKTATLTRPGTLILLGCIAGLAASLFFIQADIDRRAENRRSALAEMGRRPAICESLERPVVLALVCAEVLRLRAAAEAIAALGLPPGQRPEFERIVEAWVRKDAATVLRFDRHGMVEPPDEALAALLRSRTRGLATLRVFASRRVKAEGARAGTGPAFVLQLLRWL